MEGLVNALIHRNYLEIGSEVHIDLFDDRLEIYSPGGMVDGTKVQDMSLMSVPSKRRNPVIADIFSRLKFMDRRGSGFKKILGDYRMQPQYTEAMEPKIFTEHDSFFLVLKNLNYEYTLNNQNQSNEEATQKTPNKLIELIKQNPRITIKEMAENTGITVDGVKYHIRNLKMHGIIERVGADKGGCWKIMDDIG